MKPVTKIHLEFELDLIFLKRRLKMVHPIIIYALDQSFAFYYLVLKQSLVFCVKLKRTRHFADPNRKIKTNYNLWPTALKNIQIHAIQRNK